LGSGPETLAKVASGSHPFLEKMKGVERPLAIIGQAALGRPDGASVLALAAKAAIAMGAVKPDLGWNGFSVLHTAAARVAGLDLGLVPGEGGRDVEAILDGAEKGEIEVVYLFSADEIDTNRLGKAFVIYQGSHGDRGAHRADVLPGAAYTEKDALYANTEGRPQMTARAVFPPGEAREDWKIIRALSGRLGQALPFNTAAELRAKMFAACPHLALLDQILPADSSAIERLAAQGGGKTSKERFGEAITDFYLTNPIARASEIMASLSRMHAAGAEEATGTHG
jgi:NADH-quinone oxidoreductase subunit G